MSTSRLLKLIARVGRVAEPLPARESSRGAPASDRASTGSAAVPEFPSTISEVPSTVPEVPSIVPEVPSIVPEVPSTVPEVPSTVLEAPTSAAELQVRDGFTPPRALRGSAQVRHVDAGSCNGCEIELGAAFGPVYDVERVGARLVASPRHADVIAVTGVVTQNMAEPLLNTVDATPNPRVIVSIGDCTRGCGVFAGSYAVAGSVDDFVEVDVHVPGCPPPPEAIVAALRAVTGR